MYLPKKELYDNKSNMQAMLMGQKFMYCINRFFRNVSLFMAVGGVYSLGNTLDLAPKIMDNTTGIFLGVISSALAYHSHRDSNNSRKRLEDIVQGEVL